MRKQRGVTMIGWIFLLIPMAIVLYAAIRVGPVYYEYYKLASAVTDTAKQLEAEDGLTPQKIRGALQKRFDTGYVDDVKAKDLDVTRNENSGWDILLDYDATVPLFGNLFLTIDFDKTITIDQPQS
jgi:Flp pilus assembly protein TadG